MNRNLYLNGNWQSDSELPQVLYINYSSLVYSLLLLSVDHKLSETHAIMRVLARSEFWGSSLGFSAIAKVFGLLNVSLNTYNQSKVL
ncbi:hypothetical protein IQ246_21210 [aff. Roholtiella sp. LEGE 12411]|uniref:hypothetical protein n=1 Tax=aff. Roholtiella sp. LEGE 12411 TaxID=1828822 RepID=UPI00187E9906|nr:hypothetical protein [aff. Roholtiella sp. LEGE 12411]MBE9037579.1 hypothetical protein [aff. Roholtiella sp. LEGE 12411]